MRIAFLHPDLGLGGAERLIVDAATELVRLGHTVDVYTAYYDPARCFEETKIAGFGVQVAGSWFPRHILGKFIAVCAYIRCMLTAIYIAWVSRKSNAGYEVVIVDQVSAVIPLLQRFTSSKVLFYCHFPDLLLATRKSRLKQLYRAPLDWVEQTTTGQADLILVNSKFTLDTFQHTFKRLHTRGISPQVLYPAVHVPSQLEIDQASQQWRENLGPELSAWVDQGPLIVSINRFERKKGLPLAIQGLSELFSQIERPQLDGKVNVGLDERQQSSFKSARLLLAGGYDKRLAENVEHLEELKKLVDELGLKDRVRFLPSFTDSQRAALLAACKLVVYTPQHEHFGIVPIEAMVAGRPVVAVNSGGPMESVVDGQTGLLCDPTPAAFAQAYRRLLAGTDLAAMGAAARKRVQDNFSREAFGRVLDVYVKGLVGTRK